LLGYAKSGTNSIYSLIFGDTVNLGRHFSAIGGLDYAHVKTANYNALTGVRGSHYDEGSLSPSASVLYKPISNLTAYFTYMQSVTPGQVVGTTYQNANAVLPPFKNYEYEEGVKYQLPKGALLTVAWYRLDIESTLSSDGTNHGILEETGREIHNGLDTSISGKITNSLVLMGGYSYIDAKLTKQNPAILDGQQPSEVPPNLWKMTVEYQPSFVKNLFVTGGTYFNGASYSTNIYAPGGYNVLYPGYVQVDLGARYARRFDKVQTIYRLNIMNLNNSYQTSYGDFNHARSVNFGSTISF
jgi:iron complex outermembrane receptor protein